MTFLQQPTSASQLSQKQQQQQQQQQNQQQQQPQQQSGKPIAITQPFEMRSTPTNLTTFQANAPLTTFQASDKSSTSRASSSLGYTKDNGSPIGSSLGQNSCSIYNEKLSPSGSTIGQTTPLVYPSPKRHSHHHHSHHHHLLHHLNQPVESHLQELAVSAFNHNYNNGNNPEDTNVGSSEARSSVLDSELNPQWEFRSSIDEASYTILNDWTPGRDCLIDDFTILGFRPQDEITTEL